MVAFSLSLNLSMWSQGIVRELVCIRSLEPNKRLSMNKVRQASQVILGHDDHQRGGKQRLHMSCCCFIYKPVVREPSQLPYTNTLNLHRMIENELKSSEDFEFLQLNCILKEKPRMNLLSFSYFRKVSFNKQLYNPGIKYDKHEFQIIQNFPLI